MSPKSALPAPTSCGRLFRPLLPETVRLAAMPPADADPAYLLPDEACSVERAVEKRRREFAAGRILARQLLAQMTSNDSARTLPLLNDANRVPIWPAGIVGSITHCHSLCAVATSHVAHSAGIGLDVEPAEPMKPELERYVMRDAEYARIDVMPLEVRMLGGVLVFSIKEAVYKAIYPITRRFLEFQQVEIVSLGIALEPCDDRQASGSLVLLRTFCGDFEARVLVADAGIPGLALIAGRYRIADGHIAAAVVLPPANPQCGDSLQVTVGGTFVQTETVRI